VLAPAGLPAEDGRTEMREAAALLRTATAPLPPWTQIEAQIPRWKRPRRR